MLLVAVIIVGNIVIILACIVLIVACLFQCCIAPGGIGGLCFFFVLFLVVKCLAFFDVCGVAFTVPIGGALEDLE